MKKFVYLTVFAMSVLSAHASTPNYSLKDVGGGDNTPTDSVNYLDTGWTGVGGGNARTYDFWVKPSETGDAQLLMCEGDVLAGNGKRVDVRVDAGTKLRFESAGGYVTTGVDAISRGAWQHVAITVPDNDQANVKIYINGVEQAVTFANGTKLDTDTSLNVRVLAGQNNMGNDNHPVEMDEYRYWNKALSQAEVTALYQAGTIKSIQNNGGTVQIVGGADITDLLWNNLRLYYNFDNQDLTNHGSEAATATMSGTLEYVDYTPAFKLDENFDGLTIDSIVEPAVQPKVFNDGTWAAPASKTLNSLDWTFVQVAATDSGTINGSKEMRLVPINGKPGNATSIPDQFAFASVDLDGSKSNVSLSYTCNYIATNGSMWIQTQVSHLPIPDYANEADWTSLESPWPVSNGEGNHDKSFTLTGDVYHIRFRIWGNGGGGYDSTNDLVAFDNVRLLSAPSDSVELQLDGDGDYITMDSYDGVLGSTSRTVAAWIKTSGTNCGIVSWGNPSGSGKQINFLVDPSGKLRMEVGSGYKLVSAPLINNGTWRHVAFTYDSSIATNLTGTKFYIDGVDVTANTNTNSQVVATEAVKKVKIGTDANSGRDMDGSIDDVAIFDKALSADEIASIYNSGRGGFNAAQNQTGREALSDDVSLKLLYDAATRKGLSQIVAIDGNGMTMEGTLNAEATTSPLMVADDDNFNVDTDTFTDNVIANDTVIAGSTISWETPIAAVNGTLSATDDAGNFTYTFTDAETNNNDTFNYTLVDSVSGARTIGTVSFTTTYTPAIGVEFVQDGNELTWTVADEIGVKEYRIVDAATGEIIEVVVADGKNNYAVTVEAGIDAKLVVVDNSGYTQTFIPADGNIVKVEYTLTEGWNLIAMPGANADVTALPGVVWGWNGTSYDYVAAPEAGQAVWVYAPAPVQVIVSAEKVEAELVLEPGWNMVGPTENMNIPESAHTVYGWNETYQNIATEDGVLIQGIGYWIFSL